jgi:hypothetical protein
MARREPQTAATSRKAYPAEKARQGEIVLVTPTRRFIFIAGLALAVIIAILLRLFG